MNAVQIDPSAPVQHVTSTPLLRTVVLCDLVDSTALIQQLGDSQAAQFMHRLDRQCRDLLVRHGGREIDKTDGFLLLFERPIQAVAFALEYQRLLIEFGQSEFLPLRARVGIHVGDVVLWENTEDDIAHGAKPLELEGLVKPVAARLMELALPGQILLSGIAHTLAIRAQHEIPNTAPVKWRSHGRYLFKGVSDAVPVHEIGETEIAPLRRPAYSGKAFREVPWWRRPSMLVVESALLIAAIAIPAWIALRSQPAIAFADRDWVVVGDLNNLTSKTLLNETLENAFRLGLEQSQYVNVLSVMKTRDTVALMQRDPEKTRVDRAIGSEIAIRDGARALILPTVAEVGGYVRVTAEVIDPKTQTTVYTESADGNGINSLLTSIDTIDRNLRVRLGEALASVSKQSKPLDKVATGNLDALRAYSLGQRAYFTGNMKDALAYYKDAVKLDPQFATAHLVIARVLLNADENTAALKQLQVAVAIPNRLSARDSLLVDAWYSTLESPDTALQKWKTLTGMYPDFYPASGPYSYFAWCNNQYADAITAAKLNLAPQNPNQSAGENLLGILYLAAQRFTESDQQFQRAKNSGFGRTDYAALVYAAQRDFDGAKQKMIQNRSPGISTIDRSTDIIRIAITVDQGHWNDAKDQLVDVRRKVETLGVMHRQRIDGIALGLQSEFGEISPKAVLDYGRAVGETKADNSIDVDQNKFQFLFAIYLLAQAGDVNRAQQLFASENLSRNPNRGESPIENMRLIVNAELARAEGHPQRAVEMLKPLVDGNELFVTHRALLDAYASLGQKKPALDEAQWLAHNRGRAYGEYGANQFMMAFNIVQSDLALLRSAELLRDLGKERDSAKALNAFSHAWPNVTSPKVIVRLHALQHTP